MKRRSGILLHISSLPSGYGIGTLGAGARRFADFLYESGFSVWQVLPFCMPDEYGSPYKSRATFSVNPYLIDLEQLFAEGLITEAELSSAAEDSPYLVDYERLYRERLPLLARAAERARADKALCMRVGRFMKSHPEICAAAEYLALSEANGGAPWQTWTIDKCDPVRLFVWKFIQYEFHRQWRELKAYANKRGIEIVGDMPMYVDLDSADVWANPKSFRLDSNGYPLAVAGVPPDAFSEDGQLWGNPLYDYAEMEKDSYQFWRRRIEYALTLFDGVRIDHFRAFEAYWQIPTDAKSAKDGEWITGPGKPLIDVIRSAAGDKLIIAEDLGVITDGVRELLEYSGMPGMRVMQFAFSEGKDNLHMPHNYVENSIAYTGTHDNDTTLGYLYSASEWERERALAYCSRPGVELSAAVEDVIKTALRSASGLVVIPMQDILGYGADTRMNTPGRPTGNWAWRLADWQLELPDREKWNNLNRLYARVKS